MLAREAGDPWLQAYVHEGMETTLAFDQHFEGPAGTVRRFAYGMLMDFVTHERPLLTTSTSLLESLLAKPHVVPIAGSMEDLRPTDWAMLAKRALGPEIRALLLQAAMRAVDAECEDGIRAADSLAAFQEATMLELAEAPGVHRLRFDNLRDLRQVGTQGGHWHVEPPYLVGRSDDEDTAAFHRFHFEDKRGVAIRWLIPEGKATALRIRVGCMDLVLQGNAEPHRMDEPCAGHVLKGHPLADDQEHVATLVRLGDHLEIRVDGQHFWRTEFEYMPGPILVGPVIGQTVYIREVIVFGTPVSPEQRPIDLER